MRTLLTITAAVLLFTGIPDRGWGDDQADPQAVLDKAIAAVGGEAKLAKFKARTWTENGTVYVMDNARPFSRKVAVQWPAQSRDEYGQANGIIGVLNRDKGWQKRGDATREMSPTLLAFYQEQQYLRWVTCQLPLQDKAFTFSPVGTAKIDDREAVGIRVSHKDHADATLFFDKQTGLLVKAESIKTYTQDGTAMSVNVEDFYSNYQDVEGVKVPLKIIQKYDGKLRLETELTDFRILERLDDSVFAQP